MLQVQTCKLASWCAKCVKLCLSLLLPLLPTLQGLCLASLGGAGGSDNGQEQEHLGPIWLQWWPGSGGHPVSLVSI